MTGWLYRISWTLTTLVALAVSWWSLDQVALHYAVPPVLAAGISAVFDLAALVVVGLCQRYAESPDSGAGPRVVLGLLMAGSVYLNVIHAAIEHYGAPGRVLFAAPAVVAVVLFELDQRFRSREQRRALGRVAPALPAVGGWAFVMYPVRAVKTLRSVVRSRLDTLAAEVAAGAHSGRPRPALATAERPNPVALGDERAAPTQAESHDAAGLADNVRPLPQPRRAPAEHPDGTYLAGLGSDADRIRWALERLDSEDTSAVCRYLAERGQLVTSDNVRAVVRRDRARPNTISIGSAEWSG